ncbi:MAG: response regulator [SAR202 cluster bacterium]|nr:response regulator [SAR202 cluster bacterium]
MRRPRSPQRPGSRGRRVQLPAVPDPHGPDDACHGRLYRLQKIRQSNNVPIVFVTALGGPKDLARGLEAGADDYVVKPFSPRELIARVKSILRRTEVNH